MLPLVVHSDQIELRATPCNLGILLAQHLHAVLPKQFFSGIFGIGIDLVIAVAPPHSQRCTQTTQFFYALLEGIARAGQQIAGNRD